MKTIIPDIEIEIHEDGFVDLEQDMGGEMARISLHPAHMRFLFETVGYVEPVIPNVSGQLQELRRRIAVLADRLQEFAGNEWIRGEIIDRCGSSLEILAKLDAICDLAMEFDGGRLVPGEPLPTPSPVREHVSLRNVVAKPTATVQVTPLRP